AETVYIVPIESDEFRCMPEAKMRVYRTRDAGESWEPLTRGLPQQDALETVLRDALATDSLNPAGVYFGTRSGQLWGSRDGGASWALIRAGLPPVVCVKAAVVGDPLPARAPWSRVAAKPTARKHRPRRPGGAREAATRKATSRKAAARLARKKK